MDESIVRAIFTQVIGITPESCESPEVFEQLVSGFFNAMRDRLGKPLYPSAGESLALSIMTPKTAALAFDKVYRIPVLTEPVPEELGFYFATLPEFSWWAAGFAIWACEEVGVTVPPQFSLRNNDEAMTGGEVSNLRFLCSQMQANFGVSPTIFYHEKGSYERDCSPGSRQVLKSFLTNVMLVDEKALSWDQVVEFRRDAEARTKYRRLVRWIADEMKSSAPAEVVDRMATRLDDYEWAVRKHGIKTKLGILSSILEPKFLTGAAASMTATGLTAGPLAAAITGSTVIIGQAVLSLAASYVDNMDVLRKDNYELAYIYDIKKLTQ